MQHRIRSCATRFSASTNVLSRNLRVFGERNMSPFPFFDTVVTNAVQDVAIRPHCSMKLEFPRFEKDHHGPFATSNGWNERLVIQPTSTVSSVPCVPWRSINRCSEFNVYTRNMYVSSAIRAWLASYVQCYIPHARFAFSHIASFLSTFRSIPHYLCIGYLISMHH